MNVKIYILNKLKKVVIQMREISDRFGIDYENVISDWMFSIETEYQTYHNLDEHDWDLIKTESTKRKER